MDEPVAGWNRHGTIYEPPEFLPANPIKLVVNAFLRIAAFVLAVLIFGLVACWATGIVSFTRVKIMTNEPLRDPVRVKAIAGRTLVLETGQLIVLDSTSSPNEITNQLVRSDFQIDIEQGDTNGLGAYFVDQWNTNWLDIYVRSPKNRKKDRGYVRPLVFTIPLLRKTVGANERVWVAAGRCVTTNSQGAAPNAAPAHR